MNLPRLFGRGKRVREGHNTEKKQSAGPEDTEALAPNYFDRAPMNKIINELERIFSDKMEITGMERQGVETIAIWFSRDGKHYRTRINVARENNAATYCLEAEFFDEKNKKIYTKNVSGLDYVRVEHSLKLAFSQAFMEE